MAMPTGGMPPPIDDELLSAWLDGQVSPTERAAVEAAIAADPAVRARATDLRATVALVHGLPQPAPRRTFILTPEQAAAIRPVRVAWITRLFPAVAAASAVAAVLCLALIAGDLATGAFGTKQRAAPPRPAIESVTDATVTRATAAIAAPTTAPAATTAAGAAAGTTVSGASASGASAPLASVAASSARSAAVPASGSAAVAPTGAGGAALAVPPLTPTIGSFTASTIALPVTPTIVANIPPPTPVIGASPPGGATVIGETHRVPVALVRAGEILLALLAIAGLALALFGWRAKTRRG